LSRPSRSSSRADHAVQWTSQREGDPSRIREGFFTRDEVDPLCTHLPDVLADVVRLLFCSAWRVSEVRSLEWRDYDRTEGPIRSNFFLFFQLAGRRQRGFTVPSSR
jgi:integrase